MLFTHFGISGPLTLSASCHMKDMKRGKYSIVIDFKPALDRPTLDARVLSDFKKALNKDFQNDKYPFEKFHLLVFCIFLLYYVFPYLLLSSHFLFYLLTEWYYNLILQFCQMISPGFKCFLHLLKKNLPFLYVMYSIFAQNVL